MIDSIVNMKRALMEVRDNFDSIVIDVCKEFEPEIIDMNTAQLEQGLNGEGQKIEPSYAPLTVSIKREKGQPTARVTLFDEGGFYAGFFVNFQREMFSLGSADEKALKLERRYGKEIYGLNESSLEELRILVFETLAEEIRKRILQ